MLPSPPSPVLRALPSQSFSQTASTNARQIELRISGSFQAAAGELEPQQSEWYKKYKIQENAPKPEDMLLNTDSEPDLKTGFVAIFNGNDLSGWTPKGGACKFEAKNGILTGTCVPNSPSTYLCTDKADYSDFVFTCDMKWEVDGNSGVMFRSQVKAEKEAETVFDPQAEMEADKGDRKWSGGIYGQSCGGYFYPLWLKEHKAAREALKLEDWNRLTIMAKGNVVKTWINSVPSFPLDRQRNVFQRVFWASDSQRYQGHRALAGHSRERVDSVSHLDPPEQTNRRAALIESQIGRMQPDKI